METITRNQSPKVRQATLHGRDYLVFPLTLIVPGVLNGSQGPLYYPIEEISKDPTAWNGVPIVVRHPQDSGGRHRSGRDPDVLNEQGVGYVFKAKANGKLQAEGWFDVERTEKVDPRILQNLRAGKPIELSTGLFTDNEPAENGASYKGRSYAFIARNYRPDHLAILPDQEGACSVRDGCGVNVNTFCATGPGGGIDPKCGKDSGTGTGAGGREETYASKFNPKIKYHNKDDRDSDDRHFTGIIKKADREISGIKSAMEVARKGLEDLEISRAKTKAEAKKMLDDASARTSEARAAFEESVKRLEASKAKLKAMQEAKKSMRAKRTVSNESPVLTRAQRYFIRNYLKSVETGKPLTVNPFVSEEQRRYLWQNEPEIAKAWAHGKHTSSKRKGQKMPGANGPDVRVKKKRTRSKGSKQVTSNQGRRDMVKTRRLKPEVKKSIIDDLINNCGDCGWDEEDREVLNALPDEKLMTMDECRKLNMAKNEEAAKKIKDLEAVVANTKKAVDPDKKEEKTVTASEKTPLTNEEVMAALTPEMREDLAFARAEKARQKTALIERLTANIEDDTQKAALNKRLQSKPIDELQDLLALAPQKVEDQDAGVQNYSGMAAGSGPVANKGQLTYVGMPSEMEAIAKASK